MTLKSACPCEGSRHERPPPLSRSSDCQRTFRQMEGDDRLAAVFRAEALCSGSRSSSRSHGKGSDQPASPIAGRWRARAQSYCGCSAEGDLLFNARRTETRPAKWRASAPGAANISASSRLLHTPTSPLLQSNLPVEAFVNRVRIVAHAALENDLRLFDYRDVFVEVAIE